jgi:hypothetical protein
VGPCNGGLVGLRSLDALLEGAAVRYATEDARNILRVIHVAEAVEYLVLVAGVEVRADIEGVAMLVQIGTQP